VLAPTLLMLAGALGCGSGGPPGPYETTIGLLCGNDLDCAPGARCEHGKEFGDGTCSYACRAQADCPGGSACVEVSGGSCLVGCLDDGWCAVGFHCMRRKDHGDPGESLVCVW
jgi:hypothetical protein